MKKILLSSIATFVCIVTFAQTPQFVSTEKQMQTTLIEEFTGQRCGICPFAHKALLDISSAYKGIVSMNIHNSSNNLTEPNDEYPMDYRTRDGQNILYYMNEYIKTIPLGKAYSSIPCIIINRRVYNYASSKHLFNYLLAEQDPPSVVWEDIASQNQTRTQKANVAVKQRINKDTRELVATVEVYYIEDGTTPQNFLNLVLIQDTIIGQQVNAQNNPSQQVTIDGKGYYYQLHVLRDYITDSLTGDTIPNTTAGSFFTKEYHYTLPDSIRNIPVDLNQMSVIAFVTEEALYGPVVCAAYPGMGLSADNKVNEELAAKMSLYPNPAKQYTNLAFYLEKDSKVDVAIYNVSGRKVLDIPSAKYGKGNQEIYINTQKLPVGAYTVKINTEYGTAAKGLMVR